MSALSPYDPSFFVNREAEVQCVRRKVARLLEEIPDFTPHTAFHGPRGCGKSWLLHHLREDLLREFGDRILLAFSALNPDDPQLAENTIRDAGRALGFRLPLGGPLDELSRALTESCRRADRPVVLFADELDQVPPDRLREVDLYYIAPLYRLPNVLFVLGSRVPGPGGRLNDVEFKRRVENQELPPFDLQQTEEQVRRLGCAPRIAPDILEAGGGYPISNAILAPKWTTDPCEALEECAQALLDGVPPDLQKYFWALCVLDVIDINRMPCPLAVYFGNDPSDWDAQRCRRILMDMVRTHLVRWAKWTPFGYGMDPAVQRVLRNALRRNQPALWEKLAAC